jgi:hypothetical protein
VNRNIWEEPYNLGLGEKGILEHQMLRKKKIKEGLRVYKVSRLRKGLLLSTENIISNMILQSPLFLHSTGISSAPTTRYYSKYWRFNREHPIRSFVGLRAKNTYTVRTSPELHMVTSATLGTLFTAKFSLSMSHVHKQLVLA